MQLALVSEQPGQSGEITAAAVAAGWKVACETDYAGLTARAGRLRVDAVILRAYRVDERVLQSIRMLNVNDPVPVLLLTEDAQQASIRAAVSDGVPAYVLDNGQYACLGAHLEIACARFVEHQQLRRELQKARHTLAERNQVERAKGIIMRQRAISEDAAYRILRKLAMDRNRRIGEVAGEIIAVADVLI